MSIEREYRNFHLVCDNCFDDVEVEDDFFEAIEYAKRKGWKIQKEGALWQHYCPECKEASK